MTVLVLASILLAACAPATTQAPAPTEPPVTEAPATEAPATEAPTTETAATEAPTIEATPTGAAAETTPVVSQPQGYGTILARVKERGKVVCGGRTDLLGFGYLDDNGNNIGFDVDLCHAVAAAVLGDASAIEIVPLTAADRGPALQTGEVDLLARTATWTSSRDSQWGNFTWIMFYDGQGFIVRNDSGVTSMADLDGATICVTSGTTTESNLATTFAEAGLTYEATIFEETSAVYGAYEQGQCDAATSDKSQLASVRAGFQNPDDHVILEETISKEPLTPAVPAGDDQWLDIVKTVMWALIAAEENGITSANVEEMKGSENARNRTLLGAEGDWGYSSLGLEPDALSNAIAAVGNYGEIYDRYFGAEGIAFTLPRGLNELWTNGGLIYAPPIQ
jgi:general L-amino acid transport system substrate-binding protein